MRTLDGDKSYPYTSRYACVWHALGYYERSKSAKVSHLILSLYPCFIFDYPTHFSNLHLQANELKFEKVLWECELARPNRELIYSSPSRAWVETFVSNSGLDELELALIYSNLPI